MDRTTGRAAYRAVRDMLVRHRDDYDAAVAAFRWPEIGDRFNWALDWFDPVAAGNPQTALRIIGEDGTDRSYSSPRCPNAPIGSLRRWPPAASRPAIGSW
jgi:acetyl-CoA synthetase